MAQADGVRRTRGWNDLATGQPIHCELSADHSKTSRTDQVRPIGAAAVPLAERGIN